MGKITVIQVNEHNQERLRKAPPNRIVYSSFSQLETSWESRAFSCKYVRSGQEEYLVDGKRWIVPAGHFLWVPPNLPLQVYIEARDKVKGFCFYVSNQWLHQALTNTQASVDSGALSIPAVSIPPPMVFPAAGTRMGSFIQKMTRPTTSLPAQAIEQEHYHLEVSALFAEHIRDWHGISRKLPAIKASTRIELGRRIFEALAFLHDNWNQSVRLEEIARAACLSEYHFLRSFKNATGLTPFQYLQKVRLQKAREMIERKDQSLTEIALNCGFSDLAYFSRQFKRRYGHPPSRH